MEMKDLNAKIAELGKKHAEALLKEVVVEYAFPALKIAAEKSETKFDDLALAALEQPLKDALIALIDQLHKEA